MTTPRTISTWVLGVVLVLVCSPLISSAVYTYTRAGESARVHAATASTLNFQARLMGSNGALVADGSYSIQFKLYDAVTGGTNEWTETQTVTVKNGYFSSYLGTVTPFSGSIDWSQEKWLTMNVNGDGEMTPRIKLTAVPYALRSGQADSLTITGGTVTGDNLLQKAPGAVQSVSSANAGLRFNQTGAGGLIQLQGDGVTVFSVDKTGNAAISGGLTLGGSTNTTAGTLRWSGSDFEGYNGTSWVSLTATGGTTAFTHEGNTLAEDAILGTTDNYALRFITNNTEKMTILANGNVGIGDTTPAALFTVGTADALQIDASGNLLTSGTITSGAINGQDIDATANFTGTLGVAGLTTLNGGLTIQTGDTFTFNGDAFTDLTGTGLTNNGGVLEVVLGTTIGNSEIETNAVTLGAQTTGDYVSAIGSLVGLSVSGNSGEGSTPGLSVLYGSGANTAVQGNTQITIAAGTGLSGGGAITLGAGGTQTLNLANTTVAAASYGSSSLVPTFTVDAQGRLTAAGTTTLSNSALQNSSFSVSLGSNLSGSTSVALGGTLTVNLSATPSFTSVSTGTLTVTGAITGATSTNTINGLIINSGALSGVTTLNMSGGITAATTNTINGLNINAGNISGLAGLTFTSGGINLNNGGITNAGALSGITTLQAASGKFNVDANGGLTSGFTQLNGLANATAASGLAPGTIQLGAGNTANFDVGNYVLVNGMYAKITAKTTSALSITPNLTWANGATVTEYYVPEIGGGNTTSTLTNRFGRGYFIAGVVTGNGTTYYNEDGISTNLSTFNIANESVTTLNIGGAATNILLGTTGTTVTVAGNLQTAANQTITAGGGLVVNANGIDLNSTGIFEAGAISGVTTISASGGITAATTNTINGLSINAGALSGITGFGQTTGNFSVTGSGSITLGAGSNALTINSTAFDVSATGALSGITTISASGSITAATSNTINGLSINSGAISGVTTLSMSGGITAATANTINGLNINAGNISGLAGLTFTSGGINLNSGGITNAGAISGVTTISASGAITAATSVNTINGLVINSGALSSVTGITLSSGNINANNGNLNNISAAQFNTAASNPAWAEGLLFYDNTQKALSYYNSEAATTLNIGQENYVYVYNNTGATISDGQVVYVNGVNAGVPTVALARADVATTSLPAGIATHSIEAGTYGFVTAFGEINGLNTSTFAAGDTVYLSATTAGALTNVRPTQPNFTTIIGRVTDVNAATGKIVVNLSGFQYGAYTAGAIGFGGADGNIKQDATNFFWDDTNNRLGIGTSAPSEKLTVTNGNILARQTATGAALILDRTDGVAASLKTGLAKSGFFFDSAGSFSISTDTRANLLSGTGAGTDILTVLANGNASLSGVFTAGTGLNLTSGNFAMTGTGTFGTGTGAVSLNGATSVSGANTFVVGSGTSTFGGRITANGGLTVTTGQSITLNADSFTDLTSNGLVNTAGVLTLDVTTAGTVAGTSSNSGLITAADGLSLLRGCSNGQILKWNGTVWACSADNSGLSDSRLKENVVSIGSVLDQIKNVNVVNFNFKCADPAYAEMRFTCNENTGIIAQELGALFPGLVRINEQGFNEVDFGALNFITLKAVTELAQKIDSSGNATLNSISTGGVLRLSANGTLQNINGLNLSSGGASIIGGLNNNGSGITAAGAITGVTTIGAQAITLEADSSNNLLTLKKDGNGVFTVFNTGALELKLDSANAFAVKAANGDNALNVDTLTGRVKIGAGNNGKTVLFVLDTKSSNGDPAGVNGAQYYNSSMKKFRCYQNDKWQDCLQTAFSEYAIASGGQPWTQPSGDHELPGENRTWIDLGNANQARLLINLSAAGNQGASCRLQYSLTEDNPTWNDLTDSGNTTIDRTGAVKGDWLQIRNEAKGEVLVRVYCSGGNNSATVQYTSIRAQVR